MFWRGVLLMSMIVATAVTQAQTTWYVDDDAPGDRGPGDLTVSRLDDQSAQTANGRCCVRAWFRLGGDGG